MEPRRFLSTLIILVALALVALVGFVLWAHATALLPWAGFLAGLLAVFHARQLENLSPRLRRLLAWSGALGMVVMVLIVALGGA